LPEEVGAEHIRLGSVKYFTQIDFAECDGLIGPLYIYVSTNENTWSEPNCLSTTVSFAQRLM